MYIAKYIYIYIKTGAFSEAVHSHSCTTELHMLSQKALRFLFFCLALSSVCWVAAVIPGSGAGSTSDGSRV